jgi:SPP1 gp7 family putative phage head morphogenesis protein
MLVGLLPESTRKKALRARRARPVVPSHRAELNYLGDLLGIVEHARRAGDEVAAGLRVHWDELVPAADAQRPVGDSLAPVDPPGFGVLLRQAARRFGNIEGVATRLAKLAAKRTLGTVDEALAENIRRAIGIDISSYIGSDSAPTPEDLRKIRAAMADAVEANVALIKSIPEQFLDEVRQAVEKAFVGGERFESLAKRIAHIGDVTENRAKLIARDQISKITASLNEARQVSVGIKRYTWSGALDKRERPSHRALEGSEHAWASPPLVDGEHVHPGEAINCRCAAIPVIDLSAETDQTEERQAA